MQFEGEHRPGGFAVLDAQQSFRVLVMFLASEAWQAITVADLDDVLAHGLRPGQE
jgi:hypothetical protein